jgi:hypothetical protein
VILALPIDDGDCVVVLVRHHAIAVYFLLVNPALVVEGLSDKGRLHERDGRGDHNVILPSRASGHVVRALRLHALGPAGRHYEGGAETLPALG